MTEPQLHKLENREAAFRARVGHQLANRSLDHLEIGELIGKGGAKEAYDLPGTDCVLVVESEHWGALLGEIINLHRLHSRNFPVAKVYDFGLYKGRGAMVMEKLHEVNKPSSPDTFSGQAFVNSRFANHRTIDSLIRIRDALVREELIVLDLQYGFRKDGSLRIFDPLALHFSGGGPGHRPVTHTLDELVAALQSRFSRRRRAA